MTLNSLSLDTGKPKTSQYTESEGRIEPALLAAGFSLLTLVPLVTGDYLIFEVSVESK